MTELSTPTSSASRVPTRVSEGGARTPPTPATPQVGLPRFDRQIGQAAWLAGVLLVVFAASGRRTSPRTANGPFPSHPGVPDREAGQRAHQVHRKPQKYRGWEAQ